MISPKTSLSYFPETTEIQPPLTRRQNFAVRKQIITNLYKNHKENFSHGDRDRYNVVGYNAQADLCIKSYVVNVIKGEKEVNDWYEIISEKDKKLICTADTEILLCNGRKNFGTVLDKKISQGFRVRIFDEKTGSSKSEKIKKVKKLKGLKYWYDVIVFGDVFIANDFIIRSSVITKISTA